MMRSNTKRVGYGTKSKFFTRRPLKTSTPADKALMFSDDPWNQTPADNEQWLREFKLNEGIPGVNEE